MKIKGGKVSQRLTSKSVSQSLIHKGFEKSVDFNVVLPKPPAHCARPP